MQETEVPSSPYIPMHPELMLTVCSLYCALHQTEACLGVSPGTDDTNK